MGRKRISQREAHRIRRERDALQRQVDSLENKYLELRCEWLRDYPGGVHVSSLTHHETATRIHLARRLNHAVVATTNGDEIRFYAIRELAGEIQR